MPTLTNALGSYRAEGPQLDWLSLAYNLAAMDLWDDHAWFELAASQADMARSTGRLVLLPYALDYLAGFHILTGEFSRASGLVIEAEGLDLGAEPRLCRTSRSGSPLGGVKPRWRWTWPK